MRTLGRAPADFSHNSDGGIMFGSKPAQPDGRIDTLVGATAHVDGDIHFTGVLRIDGVVKGNVIAEDAGTVIVSDEATVVGEIRVGHAVINGKVVGPIHGTESVELQAKANVNGDVHYKTLEVHLGAIVQGRLVHVADARAEKVVSFKPSTGD
jgi:cytoskeletal protein CcmA (bactofilin family)